MASTGPSLDECDPPLPSCRAPPHPRPLSRAGGRGTEKLAGRARATRAWHFAIDGVRSAGSLLPRKLPVRDYRFRTGEPHPMISAIMVVPSEPLILESHPVRITGTSTKDRSPQPRQPNQGDRNDPLRGDAAAGDFCGGVEAFGGVDSGGGSAAASSVSTQIADATRPFDFAPELSACAGGGLAMPAACSTAPRRCSIVASRPLSAVALPFMQQPHVDAHHRIAPAMNR